MNNSPAERLSKYSLSLTETQIPFFMSLFIRIKEGKKKATALHTTLVQNESSFDFFRQQQQQELRSDAAATTIVFKTRFVHRILHLVRIQQVRRDPQLCCVHVQAASKGSDQRLPADVDG